MQNNHNNIYIFWIKYFLATIMFFMIFRIIFLIIHFPQQEIPLIPFFKAIILGFRFDMSTIAFLFLPIWIFLCISSFPLIRTQLNLICKKFIKTYTVLISIIISLIFFLDLGLYFEHFTRINYLAIEYLDFINTLLQTILVQFPYNILLVLIILTIVLEFRFLNKYFINIIIPSYRTYYGWVKFFIISTICIVSIARGGFQ